MSYKYFLVVLEYLTLSLNFEGYLCQYNTISVCNGENLQINCLDNEKIGIQRVFFGGKSPDYNLDCMSRGSSDPACCRRGQGDCIFYNTITETVLKRMCSGRPRCVYQVRETKSNRCRDPLITMSDYMTVYYECIPDSLTGNICSDDEIHAKPPIYLSNKDYPLPRTGASNCECMVVKNPTYTTLTLTAIEMYIFDSRCSMSLVIETGDGEEISFPCNYKLEGYRKWKDLSSENTTFTLSNSQQQGDAYLWMEISSQTKSEDLISLYCGESLRKYLNPESISPKSTVTSSTGTSSETTTASNFVTEELSSEQPITTNETPNVPVQTTTEKPATEKVVIITSAKISTSPATNSSTSSPHTPERVPVFSTSVTASIVPYYTSSPDKETPYCFDTCHVTVGNGFSMSLKSFLNPSKVDKFCRKINDIISCFESNLAQCSTLDKTKADKELRANLAGRRVVCEDRSRVIQTFGTCYSNKKTFKRELGSCDGLLYPFADGNTGEKCKIKRELENCVVKAAKECENDEVTEHIKIISNGLFDYLYKTQDCVEESSKDEKEHTPEPEIKSVEGLDSDDNEDSNNGKGAESYPAHFTTIETSYSHVNEGLYPTIGTTVCTEQQ
uniref:SUEL-type lectin domain-containing protein n=1 Tax=Magallana gigas TaxID=29159 RepID=A0A8W8KE40_MAGGI